MRKTTIQIGGKPYDVVGLSVIQSLENDLTTVGAEGNDPQAKVKGRMRRMAIGLQNAGTFLPDPENVDGEFKASDRDIDAVIKALDAAFDGNMDEYYKAEIAVHQLNFPPGKVTEKAPSEQAPGESPATE